MDETEHEWELDVAEQVREGGDVLCLEWQCLVCSQRWTTTSGVTMPNEEAGSCDTYLREAEHGD